MPIMKKITEAARIRIKALVSSYLYKNVTIHVTNAATRVIIAGRFFKNHIRFNSFPTALINNEPSAE